MHPTWQRALTYRSGKTADLVAVDHCPRTTRRSQWEHATDSALCNHSREHRPDFEKLMEPAPLAVWSPRKVRRNATVGAHRAAAAPNGNRPSDGTSAAVASGSQQRSREEEARPVAGEGRPPGAAYLERLLRRRSLAKETAVTCLKWSQFVERPQQMGRNMTDADIDVKLDYALAQLYLNGRGVAEARLMYCGMRWAYSMATFSLSLDRHNLRGYVRQFRAIWRRPVTRESVLLQTLILLSLAGPNVALAESFFAAAASLLGLDLYARGGDLPGALARVLRHPVAGQQGAAASWTLTFSPAHHNIASKINEFDVTEPIGSTCPARRWLSEGGAWLATGPRQLDLLFDMTPARYSALCALCRSLAGSTAAIPHALRHGGASVHGLAGVTDAVLPERGPWASLQSVLRHRRPAHYVADLAQLTPQCRRLPVTAPTEILRHLVSINQRLQGLTKLRLSTT